MLTTSSEPTAKPPPIASLPVEAAPRGVAGAFRALRHRNYQLFFAGQLVSLVGTWMHSVAQGWLIRTLAPPDQRSWWLGMIAFLASLPMLLFPLVAGVVADRGSKRHLIMIYQILAMCFALAIGVVTLGGWVQIWHVALAAFLLGTVNAFDVPTRQSFVVEMVGKDDLPNGIALNSAIFNSARFLGPAIAGIIIAVFSEARQGIGTCFLLNGLSFVAAIVAFLLMRLHQAPRRSVAEPIIAATRRGLDYVRHSRPVASLMALVAVMSMFGWAYSVLLPVFAGDRLGLGPRGFGFLVSANGVGALSGALTLAVLADRFRPRSLLFTGIGVLCVAVTVFALSRSPVLSGVALAATGWGLVVFFATANTAIQRRVPDDLRGRVMSLYTLVFGGMSPIGSLIAGTLAQHVSPSFAVIFGAAVCAVCAIVIARLVPPTHSSSHL